MNFLTHSVIHISISLSYMWVMYISLIVLVICVYMSLIAVIVLVCVCVSYILGIDNIVTYTCNCLLLLYIVTLLYYTCNNK